MSDDTDEPTRREVLEGTVVAASAVALTALGGTLLHGVAHAATSRSVPRYLLEQLAAEGVRVLFGVPGATCDPLFAATEETGMRVVITASDLEAAYAADGYARTAGLAAVSVTYGVGALAMLPVIAGAYAERSPIVVINGGPSDKDLALQAEHDTLFSHGCGLPDGDLVAFRPVTAYAARATSAADVPRVMGEALVAARTHQRPVYVEIPKHLWWASTSAAATPVAPPTRAPGAVDAVVAELRERLAVAERPVAVLGVRLRRRGLQAAAASLMEALQIPWTTTFLGKAVLSEQSAGFVGVYAGGRSVPEVKDRVHGADLVLALGCVMGRQYRTLAADLCKLVIRVDGDTARLGDASGVQADLGAVLAALKGTPPVAEAARSPGLADRSYDARRASIPRPSLPAVLSTEEGLGYDELLREVSAQLSDETLLITDTSLSMYPAAEVNVPTADGFLCNAVWQAIGYSVGAAVGAALGQDRRPVAVVGDGGFQMTAQALSTMVQYRLPCVVIVVDNGLYGIEQWLLDPRWHRDGTYAPRPYLALNRWKHEQLAEAWGATGERVATVPAFREALARALGRDRPTLLAVTIKPHSLPSELR